MPERPPDRLARLLPRHHRALDAEEGRPLEALLRLLAHELDIVEEDIDHLYDDWFIETCEPWAIPYLGDLVGARPLRPYGAGGSGLRAHVANTLAYRQSKGAAAALEQMARDVTGWPSVVVEFFQHLVWTQHLNHVRPSAVGTASLREAEAARMTGGPFETASHGAAAGTVTGASGRYGIPHVGVFAWRLQSYTVGFLASHETGYLGGPQPRESALGPGFRHLDPLGRDRALFNRPRSDVDLAARVTLRQVPGRLDRRLLHRDLAALRDGEPGGGDWFRDPPAMQVRLDGAAVPPERLHACTLEDGSGAGGTWRRPAVAGEVFVDPVLGRLTLHPADEGADVEAAHAYGAPFDIGAGPQDRRASVAQWWGDLFPEGQAAPFRVGVSSRPQDLTDDPALGGPVVAGMREAVQRWNAQAVPGARGVITVLDNATYAEPLTDPATVVEVPGGAHLAVVAAGWPVGGGESGLERDPHGVAPLNRRPHLRSGLRVRGTGADAEVPGTLVLDGLLVEGEVRVDDGLLGSLQVRHCTVGASAAGLTGGIRVAAGNAVLGVLIDHSIVGALELGGAAGGVGIRDAIVGEDPTADADPGAAPLRVDAEEADLVVVRSTVFGATRGRQLEAENTIFAGRVTVARRQAGCVRFCYVPPGSLTPAQYRCAPSWSLAEAAARLGRDLTVPERRAVVSRVAPELASSAYGDDDFGTLSLSCPSEIAEAAEGGRAMGAGHHLGEPLRRANLRDALDEYLPFGLDAGLIVVR